MANITHDPIMLAAQERLLTKRAKLKVMASLTPLILKDDETIEEVVERVKTKASYVERFEWRENENVVIVAEDAEYNENRAKRHLKDCGVPLKYIEASFAGFTGNKKLVDACMACVPGDDSVFISGKTGCGKTHLAIAMLRDFIEKRIMEMPMERNARGAIIADPCYRAGMFVSIPRILMEIRMTFSGKTKKHVPWEIDSRTYETEEDVINKYVYEPILILDDLGSEKTTDFSTSILNIIIDERINNLKKTIITTNLSLQEIENHIDARIASRLSAMKNIKINMPDYRKKRS